VLNSPLIAGQSLLRNSWNKRRATPTPRWSGPSAAYCAGTPRELALGKQAIAASQDPAEGLRLFVQAMFGANDFLYTF
jgi:hypothetical protein